MLREVQTLHFGLCIPIRNQLDVFSLLTLWATVSVAAKYLGIGAATWTFV